MEQLAGVADGFSGAEIETVVKAALLDAFLDGAREHLAIDAVKGPTAVGERCMESSR
ncbi:MAG TPA: hypothetical protein VKY56_04755 [Chloroflexota bacterium]|nr:hypothetical protein [Chloroflexota bacterium]